MPRPRAFDTEAALDAAMRTFWRHGYEATTLDELTKEMGIARPSLYNAFGSKEDLFLAALRRYWQTFVSRAARAVEEAATAQAGVRALLAGAVEQLSDDSFPPGCLRVGSTAVCHASEVVAQVLQQQQQELEGAIERRVRRGQAEGEVHADAAPTALARFYASTVNGMAVRARLDRNRDALNQIAQMALSVWPSSERR